MDGVFVHPAALVETDQIGVGTRVWAFAHVLAGAMIGADCNIGDHCFVESGAVIGDGVTVKNGNAIWEGVTLEDGVDRKSTRLNSSHIQKSRMPSSA